MGGKVLWDDGACRVERLANGLLHARGADVRGLWWGLGFCHATDRGLQMLLWRILGQGRAAELLSGDDETVAIDRFFRKADFGRAAAAEYEKLGARHRELVDAYCAGVDAAFARKVPLELRLLGVARPDPWTPADCVRLSRMIAYVGLAQGQGDIELLLLQLVQAGVERTLLEELFPGDLDGLDEELCRKVELAEPLVPASVRFKTGLPRAIASNNWVIAGSRTKSGAPMLANDPHLEVNCLPAIWYECVLSAPGRYLSGAGMPGLPAVIIGRNERVAWGATYSFLDGIDSWIERVDAGRYLRREDGGEVWKPFARRLETIRRKGKAPVEVVFWENEHGTLNGSAEGTGHRLATRWATLDGTGARSIEGMLDMLDCRSADEGRALLGKIESAWSFVLADRDGHIAYQMSGKSPVRRAGWRGLVPLDGADPQNDWQGFHPLEALPRALDPEEGFLVTANQDLNHLSTARPINCPMGAWRSGRIAEVLASRKDFDVDLVRRLQLDLVVAQAAPFLEILAPLVAGRSEARALLAWDRVWRPDDEASLVFEAFYVELFRAVFGAALGDGVATHLADGTPVFADFYAVFDRVLLKEESGWFGGKSRADLYVAAFERAARSYAAGRLKSPRLVMRHLLLGGKLPRWLGFDRGPILIKGTRSTVLQGQVYAMGGRVSTFAPSFRFVTDLATDVTHSILAGGPSDRRFSSRYVSELARWEEGALKRTEAPRA